MVERLLSEPREEETIMPPEREALLLLMRYVEKLERGLEEMHSGRKSSVAERLAELRKQIEKER